MTPEQLAEIEARTAAATPGEWAHMTDDTFFGQIRTVDDFTLIAEMPALDDRTADFEFIAYARSDIPALIAEVRRLQAELLDAQYAVGELGSMLDQVA